MIFSNTASFSGDFDYISIKFTYDEIDIVLPKII